MSSSTAPIAIPRGSSVNHPDRDQHDGSSIPYPPPFKLQTRRGSRSAPDPWALGPLSSIGGDQTATNSSSPQAAATTSSTPATPGATNSLSASMAAASSSLSGNTANPLQSSGASRLTIVRVHDENTNAVDAGDMSDGTPSSFGATAATASAAAASGVARPGRSNSWGSNYSNGSNTSGPVPARSHSPGAARRPGGMFNQATSSSFGILPLFKHSADVYLSSLLLLSFPIRSLLTPPLGLMSRCLPHGLCNRQGG